MSFMSQLLSVSIASFKAGQSGLFYVNGIYDTASTLVSAKIFSYPGDLQFNESLIVTTSAFYGAAFAKPGSKLNISIPFLLLLI